MDAFRWSCHTKITGIDGIGKSYFIDYVFATAGSMRWSVRNKVVKPGFLALGSF